MGRGMAAGSALSSAQFVAAMEHSPIGTALVGLDGGWIWTNLAICETLGYGLDELQQVTFQDLTHPDDLDADLAHVERLISGQDAAYQMEKRYLRKDGSTVWCLLTVSLVRRVDGEPEYFISNVQDISGRKADELERFLLTERLTLATQAGGVGVWEWNTSTDAMICDARMADLYGVAATTTLDHPTCMGAIDPNHRDRVDTASGRGFRVGRFRYGLPDHPSKRRRAAAACHGTGRARCGGRGDPHDRHQLGCHRTLPPGRTG